MKTRITQTNQRAELTRTNQKVFTLIDLLTVIAVLVLTISILTLALCKISSFATNTQCGIF